CTAARRMVRPIGALETTAAPHRLARFVDTDVRSGRTPRELAVGTDLRGDPSPPGAGDRDRDNRRRGRGATPRWPRTSDDAPETVSSRQPLPPATGCRSPAIDRTGTTAA